MSKEKLLKNYEDGSFEREVVDYSTSDNIEQEVPKFFRRGYIALWIITAICLVETIYKYVPSH